MWLQAGAFDRNGAADRQPRLAFGLMIALAGIILIMPSTGYPKTMQEKMEAACADDFARLCPDAAADADRLKACMLKHRAQASSACLRFIDASE